MKKPYLPIFLILVLLGSRLPAQDRYEVLKTALSSEKYDEFCPVWYKDQIVFCSNQEDELLLTYQTKKNKGLFNIFALKNDSTSEHYIPEIFSRNLLTPYNDGPISFSPDGSLAVYSRNMDIKAKTKNIFDLSNNLGLFFAELKDDERQYALNFRGMSHPH